MKTYEIKINDKPIFQLDKVSLIDWVAQQIDKADDETVIEIKEVKVDGDSLHRPDSGGEDG